MLSNNNVMLSNIAFPDLYGAPPPVNPIPIPYPNLTPGTLPHANHIDGQAHADNKKALVAQNRLYISFSIRNFNQPTGYRLQTT
ncbi:MAG: hypothetical protein ACJASL_002350 [Paraglaciecola sp.]|jgi:hypothetical protein